MTVIIDYGDGAQLHVALPIDMPAQVETLMKQLQDHPHGPELEMSGTGLTCFVGAIGGLTTDSGKGWQYEVNGERAERGIGQTEVAPGDTILWEYGEW